MILLLASMLAWAQAVESFEPFIFDAEVDGVVHAGFMVDADTYLELGRLRVDNRGLKLELSAFDEWKDRRSQQFDEDIALIQSTYDTNVSAVVRHYDNLLNEETPTFFERTAFAWGVLSGAAIVAIIGVAVISSYGFTIQATF